MQKKIAQAFIQKQKKILLQSKDDINQQVTKLKTDDPFSDPDYVSDNAAVDTDVREQDYHAIIEAEIKDLTRRLKDVDLALQKIEKGRYGYCEKCGEVIPEARLELIPEARLCMNCETK